MANDMIDEAAKMCQDRIEKERLQGELKLMKERLDRATKEKLDAQRSRNDALKDKLNTVLEKNEAIKEKQKAIKERNDAFKAMNQAKEEIAKISLERDDAFDVNKDAVEALSKAFEFKEEAAAKLENLQYLNQNLEKDKMKLQEDNNKLISHLEDCKTKMRLKVGGLDNIGKKRFYSSVFQLLSLPWKISIGKLTFGKVQKFGVWLHLNGESRCLSNRAYDCQTQFNVSVVHQTTGHKDEAFCSQHYSSKSRHHGSGFHFYWNRIVNPEYGFIKDNAIILEVKILKLDFTINQAAEDQCRISFLPIEYSDVINKENDDGIMTSNKRNEDLVKAFGVAKKRRSDVDDRELNIQKRMKTAIDKIKEVTDKKIDQQVLHTSKLKVMDDIQDKLHKGDIKIDAVKVSMEYGQKVSDKRVARLEENLEEKRLQIEALKKQLVAVEDFVKTVQKK